MNEQKKYTAQEMREASGGLVLSSHAVVNHEIKFDYDSIRAMLRQAADAEDELAQLKASKDRWMQYQETAAGERDACIDELRKKDAEIAQLKTRLGLS